MADPVTRYITVTATVTSSATVTATAPARDGGPTPVADVVSDLLNILLPFIAAIVAHIATAALLALVICYCAGKARTRRWVEEKRIQQSIALYSFPSSVLTVVLMPTLVSIPGYHMSLWTAAWSLVVLCWVVLAVGLAIVAVVLAVRRFVRVGSPRSGGEGSHEGAWQSSRVVEREDEDGTVEGEDAGLFSRYKTDG